MTGGAQEAARTPQRERHEAGDLDARTEQRLNAIDATRFAHASEAEMARILDFYQVRWEYEPTTFPILWNLDGDVVESFAPDFYLPDLEVFLEMTTLKQRLVRKKNRKLRRLRELYPDIRIKLFYARDFRAMMLKYGRLGLAESLSGTLGQVVPERPRPDAPSIGVAAQDGPALDILALELPALDGESLVVVPVEEVAAAVEAAADEAPAETSDPPPAPGPRATPRARTGRRRRRGAFKDQAGAERKAGA